MQIEIVKKIIEIAQTAPTADNAQPFYYEWNGQELKIFHDSSRAKHMVNFDYFPSKISLGCVLELIRIAASHHQFRVNEVLREFPKPSELTANFECASLQFISDSAVIADALLFQAHSRKCGRFKYDKSELAPKLLIDIENDFRSVKGFKFHSSTNLKRSFIQKITLAIDFIWTRPIAIKNTFDWIRFTKTEYFKKRDGLWLDDLGISYPEIIMVKIFHIFPKLLTWFYPLGLRNFFQKASFRNLNSSSALFLISTNQMSTDCGIDIGRHSIRVWLRATEYAYVIQPLSEATLLPFQLLLTENSTFFTEIERKQMQQKQEILSKHYHLPPGWHPVWMFRVGKMKKPYFRTLKKNVNDVLKITTFSSSQNEI